MLRLNAHDVALYTDLASSTVGRSWLATTPRLRGHWKRGVPVPCGYALRNCFGNRKPGVQIPPPRPNLFPSAADTDLAAPIERRRRLGGMLNYYYRQAV